MKGFYLYNSNFKQLENIMNIVKTQLTLKSIYSDDHENSLRLFEIAKSLGFDIICENPRQAVLYDVDAEDIKNALRQAGFADRDFQIRLEYQRGWGFL